jgi:hypothetical protein
MLSLQRCCERSSSAGLWGLVRTRYEEVLVAPERVGDRRYGFRADGLTAHVTRSTLTIRRSRATTKVRFLYKMGIDGPTRDDETLS